MYKYIILLTFISTVGATGTKVNTQLAANGSTSGETWATDWQTTDVLTLYSTPDDVNGTHTPNYGDIEICTQLQGQIKLQIKVNNTNTHTEEWIDVYVPANTKLDSESSHCAQEIKGNYDKDQRHFFESMISLTFYGEKFRLNIHFTNSTMLGSAGWLQFAIYKVELFAELSEFPDVFHYNDMYNASGDGLNGRWWKWLGTVNQTTFQCAHRQTVSVGDNMKFSIQNMQISALNEGCHQKQNKTFDPNMCDFDYEQDDALAVVIGTVQTGFVLLTLVIYLIYLKKRGPVKVPDWIIEPAMRNATVQALDDAAYERKMSQVSNGAGPNSDPMPTKRRTLNGNDDGNKY